MTEAEDSGVGVLSRSSGYKLLEDCQVPKGGFATRLAASGLPSVDARAVHLCRLAHLRERETGFLPDRPCGPGRRESSDTDELDCLHFVCHHDTGTATLMRLTLQFHCNVICNDNDPVLRLRMPKR